MRRGHNHTHIRHKSVAGVEGARTNQNNSHAALVKGLVDVLDDAAERLAVRRLLFKGGVQEGRVLEEVED